MTFLARTPVIWGSLVLSILVGAGFGLFHGAVGGVYLDTLASGAACRDVINAMTDGERTAHFWVTVLLDTAYPLTYGAFFAGMALRFLGRFGRVAALPAFAVAIVDLTENMVQALALSGAADALGSKAWLTPLKFGLFGLAALIALVALIIALVRLMRRRAG